MAEKTTRLRDRIEVRDRFLSELADAASQRSRREDMLDTATGPEPAWVEYERNRMVALVNTERAARGLGPVDPAKVAKAERLAAGHVDYALKYALYCAELVVDKP